MDTEHSLAGRTRPVQPCEDVRKLEKRVKRQYERATGPHRQLIAPKARKHVALRTTLYDFAYGGPVPDGECDLTIVSRVHVGKTVLPQWPMPGDAFTTEDGQKQIEVCSVFSTPGYKSALAHCRVSATTM